MKNRIQLTITLLTVFCALALSGCASIPLVGGGSGFKLRPYKEATLKNGLKVLLVKDKSLPYLSTTMLIKVGSSADPKNRTGLASMVGGLLDKGTNKRSAIQLADSLDQMGASISVSADYDYTLISGDALSFHRDQFLTDFAEIVTQPSFSSSEIERYRAQVLAGLKKVVDSPNALSDRAFDRFLYGDHPYAHPPSGTSADVRRIRKKDIIKFYLEYYRPNQALLAVVGDFSDDILQQLENHFGGWESRAADPVSVAEPKPIKEMSLELIDKGDLEQTQIRIGHIGIERKDPDFLTLRVANTILGGAFSSRLMRKVRVEKGLSYGINSSFDSRLKKGPFTISTFTRHEKVGEAIQTTLETVKIFRDQGVTEEEVKSAKALLKGIFPQALETAERLAENLLILRFYGISDDYLKSYLNKMESITKDQVNAAIRKHYSPDKLKITIYAPKQKVLGQLKDMGSVQIKSYTDFL